ncbi:O-antigen ligase family protein [Qipengyuania soli]
MNEFGTPQATGPWVGAATPLPGKTSRTVTISRIAPVLFAIWVTLLCNLYTEMSFSLQLFEIYSYNVWLSDITLFSWVFTVICLINRISFRQNIKILIFFYIALVAITLLRGLLIDPLQAAFWARNPLVVPLAMASACLVGLRYEDLRKIARILIGFALILATLAVLRSGISPGFPFYADTLGQNEGRPLSASGGMLLALAGALVAAGMLNVSRWAAIFLFLFLLVGLILSGQGTALIAFLAMSAAILMLQSISARIIALLYLFAFNVAGLFIFLVIGIENILPANLTTFFEQRLMNRSTRQSIWDAFQGLIQDAPMTIKAIGFPAGQRPPLTFILPNGRLTSWDASLHSQFFGAIGDTGYLGMLALASAMVLVAYSLLFKPVPHKDGAKANLVAVVFLIGCLISGYSYEWRDVLSIPLFIVIAVALMQRGRRSPRFAISIRQR